MIRLKEQCPDKKKKRGPRTGGKESVVKEKVTVGERRKRKENKIDEKNPVRKRRGGNQKDLKLDCNEN